MNRDQKHKNIRKLMAVGKGSVGLTIPADLLAVLKWKKNQKVVVKKVRGGIIIKDWKK